jgi:hypothetical protein
VTGAASHFPVNGARDCAPSGNRTGARLIRTSVFTVAGAGLLAACAASPTPLAAPRDEPLRVTNGDAAFANFEGAAARKLAEATCTSRGQRLQSSIYDRYEAGAWVFVEGCA